jgi:hypothetical protein
MSAATSQQATMSTEEVRGIFVLGLIAVIATVRYAVGNSYNVPLGSIYIDIVPVLNIILFTWSAYAFLVVLGLSITQFSQVVLGYARILLVLGLALTLIVFGIYCLVGFAPYSLYLSTLLVAYALLGLPRYLVYAFKKQIRITKPTIESASGFILVLSVLLEGLFLITKPAELVYAQIPLVMGLIAIVVIALSRLRRHLLSHNRRPKIPNVTSTNDG